MISKVLLSAVHLQRYDHTFCAQILHMYDACPTRDEKFNAVLERSMTDCLRMHYYRAHMHIDFNPSNPPSLHFSPQIPAGGMKICSPFSHSNARVSASFHLTTISRCL